MVTPARFNSVLVPLDLTPASDRALGRLSLLPLAEDARVTLLHVVPRSLSAGDQRKATRDATRILAGEARHMTKSLPRNARIEPLVKLGAVAREIGACATKVRAELIVVGRGGARILRESFLGSTAERIVRQARLPVLVVRLPPRASYRRPALALDLDQVAHQVVRLSLQILPPPRPGVAVFHAFNIPRQGMSYPSLSQDEAAEVKDEFRLKASEELAELLATALARANVPPEDALAWTTHVWYGSPRMVVRTALRRIEPDLLALGSRGYSGAAYAFLGTVAGDLLRAAKCDVLVVPPAA